MMASVSSNSENFQAPDAPSETDVNPSAGASGDSAPGNEPQRTTFKRDYLINKLNFINFQNGCVQVLLRHRRFERSMHCEARPLPCSGKRLTCEWVNPEQMARIFDSYTFDVFYVEDGPNALMVEPRLVRIDTDGFEVELPKRCCEIANRRETRFRCSQIPVQVIQNSMLFRGQLLEFSTGSFLVELTITPPQTFRCLDLKNPLNLIVFKGEDLVFSGDFSILKSEGSHLQRRFVLEPRIKPIQRYNSKAYRSRRHKLTPTPVIVFQHPLTRQAVNLKVMDLSGSGLSVVEGIGNSLLLPGMMLPDVELIFADSLSIRFRAQVLYRNLLAESSADGEIINGLAIIDMESGDHLKLLSLLHQAENQNAYINSRVEMDALWDFFFETGFIYPTKYAYIQANKEQIKETYWKLYTQNPTIARHFIYQHKGRIMAHMGMVRLYENAWLIHHHAARKRSMVRAGLTVLNQIGRFTYDSHRLYSMHMRYLMCYFRQENHFPNSVFGGFARYAHDRSLCSQEEFAYFHLPANAPPSTALPDPWELVPADISDMQELEHWYAHYSGGLMLDGLDLTQAMFLSKDLEEEYRRQGFQKERVVLALRHDKHLCGCIALHRTDVGLNLSDLTNCLHVFVIDQHQVDLAILSQTLNLLFAKQSLSPEMPILLYPKEVAAQVGLAIEKDYTLWMLATRESDKYFDFIDKMFRLARP